MDKKILFIGAIIMIALSGCEEKKDYLIGYGEWTGTVLQNYSNSVIPGSLDSSSNLIILDGNIIITTASDDDSFNIWNASDDSNWVLIYNFSSSSGSNSLDGASDLKVLGNTLAIVGSTDDTVSFWNITNLYSPVFLGNWTATANPCSVDGAVTLELENRSGSILMHVTGRTDDTYSIVNITNPASPSCRANWTASSGSPCSMDNAIGFAYNPSNYLSYACANTGDYLSVLNTSNLDSLSCKYNMTDTVPPYSVDGCFFLQLPESLDYNYLFITGTDDSELSVYNVTDGMNPVGAGNYSVGRTGEQINCSVYILAQTGFDVSDDGKTVVTGPRASGTNTAGVTILNISDLTDITCLAYINWTEKTPIMNYSHFFWKDNIVVSLSSNSDSLFVFNGTNLYPSEETTNTCTYLSGDWFINATDHCNLSSTNLGGNDVNITGSTNDECCTRGLSNLTNYTNLRIEKAYVYS